MFVIIDSTGEDKSHEFLSYSEAKRHLNSFTIFNIKEDRDAKPNDEDDVRRKEDENE